VNAPGDGSVHGAKGWRAVVVTVTVTVIVLVCAGVSPEWISADAALIGVLLNGTQRGWLR
jgi:hypothetical protein